MRARITQQLEHRTFSCLTGVEKIATMPPRGSANSTRLRTELKTCEANAGQP